MAYARYDRDCNWYIFWHSTKDDMERERREGKKPKPDETLAMWHSDHRDDCRLFTHAEVAEMIRSAEFSRIPGYSEADRALIIQCLSEFLKDVDDDNGPDH